MSSKKPCQAGYRRRTGMHSFRQTATTVRVELQTMILVGREIESSLSAPHVKVDSDQTLQHAPRLATSPRPYGPLASSTRAGCAAPIQPSSGVNFGRRQERTGPVLCTHPCTHPSIPKRIYGHLCDAYGRLLCKMHLCTHGADVMCPHNGVLT